MVQINQASAVAITQILTKINIFTSLTVATDSFMKLLYSVGKPFNVPGRLKSK